jgi:D-cysteine desulfhydrase
MEHSSGPGRHNPPSEGRGDDALLRLRFPELRETLPFVRFGDAPSPVRRLEVAGAGELWVKDEGAYGGPWGGNKVRKLEWVLPDVRRRGRETVLTFGALGTNHGLATALYAREHGLRAALALVDQPLDDHVRAQLERLRASGAALHFTRTPARTVAAAPWLLARHASPRPPYVLPAGGSSPVGALGYVEVALELAAQIEAGELPEPAWAVVAVGSGGTAAGLALGLRVAGLRTRVLAVVVNDLLRLDARALTGLAGRSARLLRRRGATLPEGAAAVAPTLTVTGAWIGAGYGHPTAPALRAADTARAAGLELDPVYTAKAFAALLGDRAAGRLGDGPLLFLQTHGPREVQPYAPAG